MILNLCSFHDTYVQFHPHPAASTYAPHTLLLPTLDSHRPYHLSNIHTGKNVILFNDRPFEEGEVPSDGDNLSGGEDSSSDEESDSDDDSDDDDGKSLSILSNSATVLSP